ncbi:myo-inositol catabolism protein [Oleidesulfovibrio alaskensis G20]|jgi:5-deoxy-glucuronate isomerase|uniref:Myo-inositol catabolism protein n=1 Tax=Oleidesulfovibrio alaskensis (strain ATCC BAA-1058 / DSM 17464 / G20) TaxID=207559 RepID=Q316C9_OLEA2|nr:5-deoxy-glucuronate isomerase [Oleidesulfovibrio alaskensis]ABB37217.1 myo-inositol catabolism protein [Oleidesulfovibrio alaskensis G20]MBG0772597.1 5-deoxy-glucuronate isomerase [Oleidesulfovibrio alaskensis]MBL3583014.1 5-deoxy-glucuronate isomerase [Oleidesulfovibrio alaskensis]
MHPQTENSGSLLYRGCGRAGLHWAVTPQNAQLEFISAGTAVLARQETLSAGSPEDEWAVIPHSGRLLVSCTGLPQGTVIGGRKDVFAGQAHALYLPPGHTAVLTALDAAECAVVRVPAHADRCSPVPVVISPQDNGRRIVGREQWLRNVYDVIPPDFPAHRLVLGETYNLPGRWSSYPPHKHDTDAPPHETQHEEVYLFRLDKPQGFGVQHVYAPAGIRGPQLDECYAVRDFDVTVLPRGYHPVAAAPGYSLYYLWVLCGTQRCSIIADDPAHAWIHGLT